MHPTIVYVSNADSGDISVLALDEAGGALATLQTMPCRGVVMPMAVSPDRRVLYAARRNEPYTVLAFAIGAGDGHLQPLAEATLPASMAHIAVDGSGRWLFSASYHGNQLAMSPIDAKGRPAAASWVMPTGPKAHAMRADPGNRFAFATSLGGGLLMQFHFDAATGSLTPNTPATVASRPGAGPRHLAFHPNGEFVYLINELDATLDVYSLDRATGTLRGLQTIGAMPPGFSAEPWAAELRLTPDGRFLYASERRSSTLAGFAVDGASGRLTPIGHWPTQLQPRGFAISPSGRHLIAAGQLSHAVGLYGIDDRTGALSLRHEHDVGHNPTWVEAVELP
jgi:6-phosphogluconolactonase